MGSSVFAFDHLDFSDTILRVEIESEIEIEIAPRKDLIWLKSFIKQIPCADFFHALLADDVKSSTRSVKVRTLNVSSTILSSESLYFCERFKEDDTKELKKKELTLKIKASEEAALMDLLNFMYINNLSATMPHQLESVQMIAEKLKATSCVRYVNKLSKALQHEVYSGQPSCASMAEVVQPLKHAAKKDLLQRYSDLTDAKSWKEAMSLPLCALEIILESPGVQVKCEDILFNFISNWAANIPDSSEWKKVVTERLYRFIYFPYISQRAVSKLVLENRYSMFVDALPFNDRSLYNSSRKIERVYNCNPITMVHPSPRSVIVYFFVTKEFLEDLVITRQQRSDEICIREVGKCFSLVARYSKVEESATQHFGLFLWALKGMPDGIKFSYEFSVLTNKDEYKTMSSRDKCALSSRDETKFFVGEENLLGVTWADLMAQDSEFLVDGILHLRAEITVTALPPKKPSLIDLFTFSF